GRGLVAVVPGDRREQRGAAEDRPGQIDGPAGPEPPSDERREQRRREDRGRHRSEGRARRAVEALLESRREGADVGDEEKKTDDREGHLADHSASDYTATGSCATPPQVAMR